MAADDVTRSAIDKAMQQMPEDGTIESIFKNYGVEWRPPLKTGDAARVKATHA